MGDLTALIKPLVWSDSYGVLRAKTPFGAYKVAGRVLHRIGNPSAQSVHDSVEKAQAEAQADYIARVLSLLDTDKLAQIITKAKREAAGKDE